MTTNKDKAQALIEYFEQERNRVFKRAEDSDGVLFSRNADQRTSAQAEVQAAINNLVYELGLTEGEWNPMTTNKDKAQALIEYFEQERARVVKRASIKRRLHRLGVTEEEYQAPLQSQAKDPMHKHPKEEDITRQTISLWAHDVFQNAEAHGFHDKGINDNPATWCANLHGEVSELWEAYRNGSAELPCNKPIPLTCEEEELADIIIRALDTAEQLGLDIERAISIKHKYNTTRSFRHGGKVA